MAKVVGEENQKLHDRSGQVFLKFNPLIGFLYDAMKEGHLAPGDAEALVRRNTTHIASSQRDGVAYCNGWLARYAEDLAIRLSESEPQSLKYGKVISHEEHD